MVYLKYKGRIKKGKIIGFGEFNAKVMVPNERDRLKIKRVRINKLYFPKEIEGLIETDFKVGDEVAYLEEIVNEKEVYVDVKRFGTIVGLGRRAAVIEYNVNDVPKLFVVDYKRIGIKE